MASPVAYLRRSSVSVGRTGEVSHEQQVARITALAAQHGDTVSAWLEDWGQSGGSTVRRPSYRALLSSIERDEVSALYSFNLSRLGRSVPDLLALAELCAAHAVPIRLADGTQIDTTSAMGRMVLTILAAVVTMQRDLASEHSKATAAIRRARGDRMGRAVYGSAEGEDLSNVVDAYATAGSFNGAARILNDGGVPTRFGRGWSATSVAKLLRLARPELVPASSGQGVRSGPGVHMFARLIICPHCGRRMTSQPRRDRQSGPQYHCRAAVFESAHPRPYGVTEKRLLPGIMALVDEGVRERWLVFVEHHALATDDGDVAQARDELPRLEARRERLLDQYESGDIERTRYQTRLAAIDAQLAEAATQTASLGAITDIMGTFDWWREPSVVNSALRELISEVRLTKGMEPESLVWLTGPVTPAA